VNCAATQQLQWLFEDGKAPVLTQIGFERMMEAHAAGRDVIIEVAGVVIFRLPAWWGWGFGILEESRDSGFPGKHRFTSSLDPQKNPRPRPGAIVAVQKTLALATLAALALAALAALTTLLASLSGLLLLLTRLLLTAALLAALVLLSTLLTTLILLARLLFVGVHIFSSNFLPSETTRGLKRSSSKPSLERRQTHPVRPGPILVAAALPW
jgi:hypothetical protein